MAAVGTLESDTPPAARYLVFLCAWLLLASFNYLLAPVDVAQWETLAAVVLAGAIVVLVHCMLRLRLPMWTYALLPLAVLVPQLNNHWDTYWHGFMHASIVNEIYYRGGAPENPLLAGEPLLYMHAHHAVIAFLMRLFPLSPPQGFVLTDVTCLAVMVVLIDRSVRLISTDRAFRVFAGTLALCAISPLLRGPLALLVQHEWFGKIFVYRAEQRFIPIMKFVGINNNQLGLMFCAMGLYGLLALAARSGSRVAALGWIAAGLLGAGFLYPPSWASLAACAGAVALYLFLRNESGSRLTAVWVGVVVAGASAAVLPSMLRVTAGKSGSSSALTVVLDYAHLRQNGAEILVLLAPAALLMWWRRAVLLDWYREQRLLAGALASVAGVSLLIYLVCYVPGPSEYKFVHMAIFALSVPVALALSDLYRARPWIALILLILTIVPLTVDLVHQPPADPVVDAVRSDGRDLRHVDPDQDALYSWIARATPVNAVFIDSYLTIPALAHRQLLVGLDTRRDQGGVRQIDHDGWMITARSFLTQITGVNPNVYVPAYNVATDILGNTSTAVDAGALRALAAIRTGRPCFVVARQPAVIAKLEASADFRRVYRNPAGSVYQLLPQS